MAAPRACSPFSKPGKSELLFHHWGGERRGKRKREGEKTPEGKSKEEKGRLRGAGRPAGTGTASPQPRLKSKGAPATFQWKISGDGSDLSRDGYLTPMINHERQWSLFCISLWGTEEMKQWGRTMRTGVMGTPTPQLVCAEKSIPKPSLPSTLLYFWMSGEGLPPPFFLQLARWVYFLCFKLYRHCTILSSVTHTRDLVSPGDSTATIWGLWIPSPIHPCSFTAQLCLSAPLCVSARENKMMMVKHCCT